MCEERQCQCNIRKGAQGHPTIDQCLQNIVIVFNPRPRVTDLVLNLSMCGHMVDHNFTSFYHVIYQLVVLLLTCSLHSLSFTRKSSVVVLARVKY